MGENSGDGLKFERRPRSSVSSNSSSGSSRGGAGKKTVELAKESVDGGAIQRATGVFSSGFGTGLKDGDVKPPASILLRQWVR